MMPELNLTICGSMALAGMLLILIGCRPSFWNRPAFYCPGPRRRWYRWLFPPNWFIPEGCGYNLVGTMPRGGGGVRCSECGTLHQSRSALRCSPTRFRPHRFGAALLLMALLMPLTFPFHPGKLIRTAPTASLILAETYFHSSLPPDVVNELANRYWEGGLSEGQIDRLMPLLIEAMRDDDVELNADRARDLLIGFVRDDNRSVIAALNEALRSTDWQQRQIAADVLRKADTVRPTDDLLRVTLEGLRDDALPFGRDWAGQRSRTFIRNAWDGVSFLAHHSQRATPLLDEGMHSDDWQQSQLCAMIVLRAHIDELLPAAMSIVIDHLRDNDIDEDSQRSEDALIRFSVEALPWLEPFRTSADDQQRIKVYRIMDRINQRASQEAPNARAAKAH